MLKFNQISNGFIDKTAKENKAGITRIINYGVSLVDHAEKLLSLQEEKKEAENNLNSASEKLDGTISIDERAATLLSYRLKVNAVSEKIKAENKSFRSKSKVFTDAFKTSELYQAYKEFDGTGNSYLDAMSTFLDLVGIVPTKKTVKKLCRLAGGSVTTGNKEIINCQFTKRLSKKAFETLIIRLLCEEFAQ